MFAADKVVKQIMGMAMVQENSAPLAAQEERRYAMPARTKEEALTETAAEEGATTDQGSGKLADPAKQVRRGRGRVDWKARLAARQKKDQEPQEIKHEPPERDDNGEVQWLL